MVRFDEEVNMSLILGECQQKLSTCNIMFFRTLWYSKIICVMFFNLENRTREFTQENSSKSKVINETNIVTTFELQLH